MPASQHEVTELLREWSSSRDTTALDRLIPLVYEELHRLAHHYIRRERMGHTLQTTALVNEAYVRLVNQNAVDWLNNKEASEVLGVSEATIERDWRFAKAWLYRELQVSR